MNLLLTVYLWILVLASLLAAAYLATRVSDEAFRLRLAVYLSVYNLACIFLRMVMPIPETAQILNWLDPLLGLAARAVQSVDQTAHVADPLLRVAIRATATLVISTGLWSALGWVSGGLLDDRMTDRGGSR